MRYSDKLLDLGFIKYSFCLSEYNKKIKINCLKLEKNIFLYKLCYLKTILDDVSYINFYQTSILFPFEFKK